MQSAEDLLVITVIDGDTVNRVSNTPRNLPCSCRKHLVVNQH